MSVDSAAWTTLPAALPPLNRIIYAAGSFVGAGPNGVVVQSYQPTQTPAAMLSSPGFTNNSFQFSISGEQGRIYTVQTTTDLNLRAWINLLTFTNNQGVQPFVDAGSAIGPLRYYRVISAAP